jgi:curved DNA-binding protein
MQYKDYYAVLGVKKDASQDAIKAAYRRLARKYHPDVSKEANAEEKFKSLQEAYEVLKDPDKRSAYDRLGSDWQAGEEFRPPPHEQPYSHFYNNSEFSTDNMDGFSDFFTYLFGHARSGFKHHTSSGFHQYGNDQHAKVSISLEDAFHGTTKVLRLQVPEMSQTGHIETSVRTLKVAIPAGTKHGQQLRLGKQSRAGVGSIPVGDLYLEIEIQQHPFYTLQGRDVYLTLPVTPWEAALGADIKVPTLGGPVGLKLAAGSQSGQKLRLKGRGMPDKPVVGDQYIILQILVPRAHTTEQRQIYEKMAQIMSFNPRKDWLK